MWAKLPLENNEKFFKIFLEEKNILYLDCERSSDLKIHVPMLMLVRVQFAYMFVDVATNFVHASLLKEDELLFCPKVIFYSRHITNVLLRLKNPKYTF
jgi:hypothetical protein